MIEIIFLFSLALIWVGFASIQDLKTRMVCNWISFSLIIFAIGFRFFYSLFNNDFSFFYQGLIGLGIFFVLGNALYYGRMFAGGDAKLMIAFGAVLPVSNVFLENLNSSLLFLLIFIFTGSVYGVSWSVFLSLKNYRTYRKEFWKQFEKNKKITFFSLLLGIVFLVLGFAQQVFFYIGIFIFLAPYVFVYAKAVDESCMVKTLKPGSLTEGDWLYKDIKIGKRTIKSNWNGLNEEDLKLLRRHGKSVKIKQGIPFVPVFFISFAFYFFIKVSFAGATGFSLSLF